MSLLSPGQHCSRSFDPYAAGVESGGLHGRDFFWDRKVGILFVPLLEVPFGLGFVDAAGGHMICPSAVGGFAFFWLWRQGDVGVHKDSAGQKRVVNAAI